MNHLLLALKLLKRDSRAGELTILVLALIIAVASSTAISTFANRLQRTMNEQTADFLAADLVITSPDLLPTPWLEKAKALQLAQAMTTEFSSVLIENEQTLLASVKAVNNAYPLRGFLKIIQDNYTQEQTVQHGPIAGQAWVEKRVLSALNLKIGDHLTVGEKTLVISHIITYETDKQGDLYSFSPRVMINYSDLAATGIIQPGSHVHHFFQYRGNSKQLHLFKQWAKPQLTPSQRIIDIYEDRPEVGSALTKAERYLSLSSILVIVISGVAIAMATRRYSERHFNAVALLRCLGLQQADIVWLYSVQFIILGIIASAIGCLLGWLSQELLFKLLRNLLPQQVANANIFVVMFGFMIGLLILLTFALPPLLRLKRVSPLRVLRRDLEPLSPSIWLVYGLVFLMIGLLIVHHTQDTELTIKVLGAGGIAVLILYFSIYGFLTLLNIILPTLPLIWRLSLQGLLRNKKTSISQILAFSITLLAMLLTFTVRNDVINNWQQQLPNKAPNHFALNIFPEQQEAFKQSLLNYGIDSSTFYPIIKGRLIKINNQPVQNIVSKDSQGARATQRDLSLTWSATLPEGNTITAGQWHYDQANRVSVEQKLAKNLKININDQLLFTIGSQQVIATVASFRSLDWNTMKPNFYMIFSPGTLDHYPSTYLTSFYLSEEHKDILNTLVKTYPAITVLEVDTIVKQLKNIVTQLTQAINYLLYFSLFSGFTVLFASIQASLDHRIQEGAIMRTLGANRYLLLKIHWLEFGGLGLISGLLTMLFSEIINYGLYIHLMHISYQANYYLWILIPVINSLCIAFLAHVRLKIIMTKPPSQILREF